MFLHSVVALMVQVAIIRPATSQAIKTISRQEFESLQMAHGCFCTGMMRRKLFGASFYSLGLDGSNVPARP
jgi:hypothetical protein